MTPSDPGTRSRTNTDGPAAVHAAAPKPDYPTRRLSPCSAISQQPQALPVPSTLASLPSSGSAWAGSEGGTEVDWSHEGHRHVGLVDVLVIMFTAGGKQGRHGGSGGGLKPRRVGDCGGERGGVGVLAVGSTAVRVGRGIGRLAGSDG
ncbi:hypothetical protein ZEAMMB73_Zm00001d019742 [Zea mays]|jgi:hypothetical protein|uniref:Uncharacterized protein n=1 Tax=Zea mays TaxID=4577 RepID=A0A1D6I075_MAIZE|nr:hypothetical protein ZEAMMB73_Zm00001d019742 [Zea mays]